MREWEFGVRGTAWRLSVSLETPGPHSRVEGTGLPAVPTHLRDRVRRGRIPICGVAGSDSRAAYARVSDDQLKMGAADFIPRTGRALMEVRTAAPCGEYRGFGCRTS
jgi:hypothetical protein